MDLRPASEIVSEETTTFWTTFAANASACIFPTLVDPILSEDVTKKLEIELETWELPLCQSISKNTFSPAALLSVAWAVVLRTYSGNEAVSFCLVDIDDECYGTAICSIPVEKTATVIEVLRSTELEMGRIRQHALPSMAAIAPFCAQDGQIFFNTAISWNMSHLKSQQVTQEHFDIVLEFRSGGSRLLATLNYSQSLMSESQAYDVANTFQEALSQILTTQQKKMRDLNLVHPKTFARLAGWNQHVPEVVDKCVGDLFQIQVKRQPKAPAVHASDESFLYQELDILSTLLAQYLRKCSIKAESVVLLCFPKSAWAVVAMLAVTKAGGAILFVDISTPQARLLEMQDQVASKLILTAPEYQGVWQWSDAKVFVVNRISMANLPVIMKQEPNTWEASLSSAVSPSNMLYVIFTSGSTGKPKGCVIEHRQFLTGSIAQQRESDMTCTDRVLQLASFTFDVSILEIITSLISGACVCIPDDNARAKGPASCIEEFGITWAFLTPSLVKLMTPAMVTRTLRFLVLGGEPLSKSDVETWSQHLQLANGYGPTECSIAATGNKRLFPTTDPANIGYPLGAMCWIVDPEDHRRLLPPGAPGELLIHGPIVAREYLHDPQKTAAAFVDDFPWLPKDTFGMSRRMYKTGDLARYNYDGTINFLRRKDDQVKLRGLRIELGEIEHHIAAHELTQQAVVILPRAGPCRNQLMAVMSLRGSCDPSSVGIDLVSSRNNVAVAEAKTRLAKDIAKHLPAYMLPSLWVVVKSIPLTISGKLHKSVVAQWATEMDRGTYNSITELDAKLLTPISQLEENLRNLCSEVIGVTADQILLDRSFINNGGDSIIGMQLATKLRRAGIQVTVQDIIRSKTISALAEGARYAKRSQLFEYTVDYNTHKFDAEIAPRLTRLGVKSEAIEDAYPSGPMQRGILLSQSRQTASYELLILCEILGFGAHIDRGRIQAAWIAVIHRHTSLRTIFTESVDADGAFDQVVLKTPACFMKFMVCEDAEQVSQAASTYKIEALPTQPQVNLVIYETPTQAFCLLAVNHALIDGVSVMLAFRDLSLAYSGLLPSDEKFAYSNYIGYLQQQDRQGALKYWKGYLEPGTPCIFPVLNDDTSHPKELHEQSCDFDRLADLRNFCKTRNVTPASIIQTAWAFVLKAYTGSNDVSFGYLFAGRDAPVAAIEQTIGVYISMLICRIRLDASSSVMQIVESTQEAFLQSIPHHHCSLANIQHELRVQEPLFDTIVSLQSAIDEVLEGTKVDDGISFKVIKEVVPTEHSVCLNVAMSTQRLRLRMQYYTTNVSDRMAKNIFGTFTDAIEAILDWPSSTFTDLNLLSHRDQAQICAWNTRTWEDFDVCIHDQVHAQVKSNPDVLAIDAWDGSLTYEELDRQSTILSRYLSSLGVGPEVFVPLVFEKSMWTVVAQLAVLKCGGACVHLDPTQPSKRHKELVRQCGARIAVSATCYRDLLGGLVENIVIVDGSYLSLLDENLPPVVHAARAHNAAFLVFTSGSTGKPKGIILEHHAIVTSAQAHGPVMRFSPASRILQFASYTFDVSLGETFTCLMAGGTVCIPHEDERMNDLAGAINRMKVDVAYLTTSVASTLRPSEVPGLKSLSLGGEPLTKEIISIWAHIVHLVNIYGPAECSIWSTCLSPLSTDVSPTNIGYGIGASHWISEVENPNKLCAVGCIGELLIDGPILARGYLNNKEQTDAAFIFGPAWLPSDNQGASRRRLYRTGDLARHNSDGSISLVGRKDNQIKIHGRRIELGEIEQNLLKSNTELTNAVVLYPKIQNAQERLVAVISSGNRSLRFGCGTKINMLSQSFDHVVLSQIEKSRLALSELLPDYMVPALWLAVESIPLSVNGKVDRLRISQWLETLDLLSEEVNPQTPLNIELPSNQIEEHLRVIVGLVLGISEKNISMNQSLVGLGMDSIAAMQVAARCRSISIMLTVRDILLSKNLRQLVAFATPASSSQLNFVSFLEKFETPFELSPIQSLYFSEPTRRSGMPATNRFNHSFLLVPTQQFLEKDLAFAIHEIVQRHSMLRARFQRDHTGRWSQRVLACAVGSYEFQVHKIDTKEKALEVCTDRQGDLDIENGPVFAAHVFEIASQVELVFFVAHHLVIDLVSWRIIVRELEELLSKKQLNGRPLPFQSWTELQAEYAHRHLDPEKVLPYEVPSADYAFWGMEGADNVRGKSREVSFRLTIQDTKRLFNGFHAWKGVEPLDVMLSCLIESFVRVFRRSPPAIFNESHGRESWDLEVDPSATVGWFTTAFPIYTGAKAGSSFREILHEVKSQRRLIPQNGWAYFNSRFSNNAGQIAFAHHDQIEILFNYVGIYQGQEPSKAIFDVEPFDDGNVGLLFRRFALIEINVYVIHGSARVSFRYNCQMRHRELIESWIGLFKMTLTCASHRAHETEELVMPSPYI